MTKINTPPILFYDADCAFCTACANFVRKHDRKKRITLRPIQSSEHKTTDNCYESIIFIQGDYQSQFSRAVIDTLRSMGGIWWLFVSLMWLVPSPIRDWLYRFVGKRRHFFGGTKNTC